MGLLRDKPKNFRDPTQSGLGKALRVQSEKLRVSTKLFIPNSTGSRNLPDYTSSAAPVPTFVGTRDFSGSTCTPVNRCTLVKKKDVSEERRVKG